jgi:hypothetical protein
MIDRSEVVLVLLGRTRASLYVRGEYSRALRKQKRVIPVVLEKGADVPLPLETLTRVRFEEAAAAAGCRLSGRTSNSGTTD